MSSNLLNKLLQQKQITHKFTQFSPINSISETKTIKNLCKTQNDFRLSLKKRKQKNLLNIRLNVCIKLIDWPLVETL